MTCASCSSIPPIENQGALSIRFLRQPLLEALHSLGIVSEQDRQDTVTLIYNNREQLTSYVSSLAQLPEGWLSSTLFSVQNGHSNLLFNEEWTNFSQLSSRVKHMDSMNIILEHCFTSHMQPIVDQDIHIIGFEFLLRPASQDRYFQPFQLFEIARETGLYAYLDRAARMTAIEASALLLPNGMKRFINFQPSSVYNPAYCLSHTFEAIDRLELNSEDFVFEVVETDKIDNMDFLHDIFRQYRNRGISVALDDVGSGYSTIEVMRLLQPDYVKIDRSLIDGCYKDSKKQAQIADIVDSARRFNGKVLAEGVEMVEDFHFCRDAGVSLAQGYLFGKPQAQPPQDFAISGINM